MAIMVREGFGLMSGIRNEDGRWVQHLVEACATDLSCQLLCADPSSMEVPELSSYLFSKLPKSTSLSTTPETLRKRFLERVGWLFPEEVDLIISTHPGNIDWEKGIPILLQKVDMISADEGGGQMEDKKLASAPLGLKNRWRIWKILQGIRIDSETY